jgi:hypothetical protein
MLAVIGLLYSFGLILGQRRALQTAADAASLAGSWQVLRELASDNRSDANVLTRIQDFAAFNGVPIDANVSAVYLDAAGGQLANVGSFGTGAFAFTARGVRVTMQNQVPTILPGFLRISQLLVRDTAAASALPTVSPLSATLVLPIAMSLSDARAAYVGHTLYDLFTHPLSGSRAPTLNLATQNGAPTFGGTLANDIHNWSDGWHSGAWLMTQPSTATLAGNSFYDSIATGLQDNVRRQALFDATPAAYALVTVPVYDTSPTATTVHIVGFVQMKLLNSNISATNARGTIVPYPALAWGTPAVLTLANPDLGAALVEIIP